MKRQELGVKRSKKQEGLCRDNTGEHTTNLDVCQ